MVSGLRIHVRVGVSLGMVAVSLWQLVLHSRTGLDVAAGRMEYMGDGATLLAHDVDEHPWAGCAQRWSGQDGCGGTRRGGFDAGDFQGCDPVGLGRNGHSPGIGEQPEPRKSRSQQERIRERAYRSAVVAYARLESKSGSRSGSCSASGPQHDVGTGPKCAGTACFESTPIERLFEKARRAADWLPFVFPMAPILPA